MFQHFHWAQECVGLIGRTSILCLASGQHDVTGCGAHVFQHFHWVRKCVGLRPSIDIVLASGQHEVIGIVALMFTALPLGPSVCRASLFVFLDVCVFACVWALSAWALPQGSIEGSRQTKWRSCTLNFHRYRKAPRRAHPGDPTREC